MDVISLLRMQMSEAHNLLEVTVGEVTEEQVHYLPEGRALPVGAAFAHVIFSEDIMIQTLKGQEPLFETGTATGASEPMPNFMKGWEDYAGWTQRVRFDLAELRGYAAEDLREHGRLPRYAFRGRPGQTRSMGSEGARLLHQQGLDRAHRQFDRRNLGGKGLPGAARLSVLKAARHEIRDRVVVITGASEGIGEATAHGLAAEGAQVALVARSAEKLEQLARELPGSFPYAADLRDMAAVRGMIEAVHDHYGRVDVLINNAARGMHGIRVEDIPITEFRELFELNVVAPLVAMQAVIPMMREQGGGVIINISSRLSKLHIPGLAGYASTKYMVNALTFTARDELAEDNIRVCPVIPGRTATRFQLNSMHVPSATGQWDPQGDSPAMVAETILRTIRTEEAEVCVS